MKLLSFTPEVNRLRRIARACAAGELSRTDYRSARRDVIESLVNGVDIYCDDTVPRFQDDVTVRRNSVAVQVPAPKPRSLAWLWLAIGALVLAGLALPGLAFGLKNIPPVKDRSVSVRRAAMEVQTLIWQVPEALQTHIDPAAVEAFLRTALAETRTDTGQHGFTQSELEQVGNFLDAIGVHDDKTRLTLEDLQDLKALVQVQKSRRGVSLEQLQTVTDRLQSWIRAQGYPLAVAYIPAQQITGATVRVDVQVGRLSGVNIKSEDRPLVRSERSLADQFAGLSGEPVRRDRLETRLNMINRLGGQSVQASFEQGAGVGETDLVLHVQPGRRYHGRVQLDNYGLDDAGSERLSYQAHGSGLFGAADAAQATIAAALDGADQVFADFNYRTALASLPLTVGGGVRLGEVSLPGEVDGRGVFADINALHTLHFTRARRLEFAYMAGLQDVDWDASVGADQQVWFVQAGAQGHRLWDTQRLALDADLNLTLGGVDTPRGQEDDNFWRLRGSARLWTPLTWGGSDRSTRLALGTRLQLTSSQLPVTQQASISHPFANPGLEIGSLQADNLLEVTSRLQFDGGRGQWWLFVDGGFAEDNDQADSWYRLITTGFGWRGNLLQTAHGTVYGRFVLGYPLTHESNGDFDDDGLQFYWSLRFDH